MTFSRSHVVLVSLGCAGILWWPLVSTRLRICYPLVGATTREETLSNVHCCGTGVWSASYSSYYYVSCSQLLPVKLICYNAWHEITSERLHHNNNKILISHITGGSGGNRPPGSFFTLPRKSLGLEPYILGTFLNNPLETLCQTFWVSSCLRRSVSRPGYFGSIVRPAWSCPNLPLAASAPADAVLDIIF